MAVRRGEGASRDWPEYGESGRQGRAAGRRGKQLKGRLCVRGGGGRRQRENEALVYLV